LTVGLLLVSHQLFKLSVSDLISYSVSNLTQQSWQFWLVANNITTVEFFIRVRLHAKKKVCRLRVQESLLLAILLTPRPYLQLFVWPYDLGLLQNFWAIFGPDASSNNDRFQVHYIVSPEVTA